MCHLNMMVLRGRGVTCATCGAQGQLSVAGDEVHVHFSQEGCRMSVISMAEKRAHFFEIQQTGREQGLQRETIERLASPFDAYDRLLSPR